MSREPRQPRNRATFEYEKQTVESSWFGLHGIDFGITKNCSKKVWVMVEAALQMAVTAVMAVLSVRSDGEYRNATAAETTSLVEHTYVAHHLRPVAVRFDPGGCFVSCEWSEALSRLDIFADPTAGQAHSSS